MDPIVHALLVCEGLDPSPSGQVTLRNVVEVVAAEEIPGTVGPLVFVAFVRGMPTGEAEAAFLLSTDVRPGEGSARLPIDLKVPAPFAERQLVVQVTVPELPVDAGGWFYVHFEWQGRILATNRFAVGTR